jgi:hypothetical protein
MLITISTKKIVIVSVWTRKTSLENFFLYFVNNMEIELSDYIPDINGLNIRILKNNHVLCYHY